jgi:outer membrane receptor protein involved in Fe transport
MKTPISDLGRQPRLSPALPKHGPVPASACGILLFLALSRAFAGGPGSLLDLSMEELSKIEIKSDITSIKARPLREQPGVVSVISGSQIRETGARDLTEMLMLVPGFALDTDVESMVGLTFRGLQGQEGKVLLIVDGMEINEPLYGSLPILNHIPADAIEQVEIIRGPGSAIYGGTAALSVIRVSTRGASQNGGYAVLTPTYTDGRLAESVGAGLGFATNNWRFSFNGAYSDTLISNQKYTSLSSETLDLTHKSAMDPLFLDLGTGWRDLDVRVLYDNYSYQDSIYYGDTLSHPLPTSFESLFTSAKYDLRPTDRIKITPQFTYRHSAPWLIDEAEVGFFDIETDRYQGDLNSVTELTDNSGLMLGMRCQRDEAFAIKTSDPSAKEYYNGHSSIAYNDFAGYAQYDLDTPWVNLSLGGRYETQEAVGGHFVPRVALTKAWERFHLKALYSQAARIPGINVVNDAVDGKLEAEQTSNYELEAGYRLTDSLSLIGNIYYMQVDKPIIFTSSGSGLSSDGYYNGSKLSTYGFESELRWDLPQLSSYLGYSFYRAGDNDIDYVRGQEGRFLAAPAHKVSLNETWHIFKGLDWNVNGFWLSERSAYLFPNMGVGELDPEIIFNTFLNYRVHQMTFGVGIANLLDQDRFAPQPYEGNVGPLPLKGREIFAKITYSF